MKYEETFTDAKVDVVGFLKKAVPETFLATLREAGEKFAIPADRDLEFKFKYDPIGGSALLKVTWDTYLDQEDEEEDKED